MARFRKRPVGVDAWQFDAPTFMPQPWWFTPAMTAGKIRYRGGDDPHYIIETLEGKMRASSGDWIIRGIQGEFYPCKPDIFEATYEPFYHLSDCAVHNEPAMKAGPCDCGGKR